MSEPRYAVKALDESTWAAFAALVERNNGIFGGCWCMAFHPEQSWPADGRERVPQKRAAKEQRVREGKAHAALVFYEADCVGWCQFGTPDELPRIKSRAAYEKGRTTAPDWRIACCYSGKGHRRQGVATAAIAGALDLIASLGGGTVEGYPEPAGSVPAGFLYNGALSTYERLGFIRDRPIGKHRWVVTRVVEPVHGAILATERPVLAPSASRRHAEKRVPAAPSAPSEWKWPTTGPPGSRVKSRSAFWAIRLTRSAPVQPTANGSFHWLIPSGRTSDGCAAAS